MHTHVLMLHRKFKLILIKFGFFTNFLSCGQTLCTIVQGLEPNFAKNEKEKIRHFYNFF